MTKTPKTEIEGQSEKTELVIRSEVPDLAEYSLYREYLRADFFFSCAYCTMAETEAQAVNFTIDHYEPKTKNQALMHQYDNLMYCCIDCNRYKGNRWPTASQQQKGYNFFRPDHHIYGEHFERGGASGVEKIIKEKTAIGYYTINALSLNRKSLQRLRHIRDRAMECDAHVLGGLRALRTFQLDQLPPKIRGRAATQINAAIAFANQVLDQVDAILEANGRSPLIDPDEDAKTHARERAKRLKHLDELRPGSLGELGRQQRTSRRGKGSQPKYPA